MKSINHCLLWYKISCVFVLELGNLCSSAIADGTYHGTSAEEINDLEQYVFQISVGNLYSCWQSTSGHGRSFSNDVIACHAFVESERATPKSFPAASGDAFFENFSF